MEGSNIDKTAKERQPWSGEAAKKRVLTYDRGYAEIDLDKVVANMEAMQANLSGDTAMIGVLKTDGYGHGAAVMADAIAPYVKGYATATVEEAQILLRHGVEKPVLILGMTGEAHFKTVIACGLRPTMFQYEKTRRLSDLAVAMGKTVKIHIAIDTGMSRIGLIPGDEALAEIVKISRLPGIEIEGIFTHFARADETDKKTVQEQYRLFSDFTDRIVQAGVKIPIRHCSNSAGILELKEMNMDAVRAGISIYGLYPSDEVQKEPVPLKPVLSWRSFVSYLKTVPAGTPVSYGGTYVTEKETKIATIPVGYGDGYPRSLSGMGEILIHGKRASILGRICMDQFMADVTHIEGIKEGDMVTLIGQDGKEEITVEDIAETIGGFHYEILCNVGKRIPRVYKKDGQVVAAKDYFDE